MPSDHALADAAQGGDLPTRALPVFVALTFAVTWGITGFYILAPTTAAGFFGEIGGTHPLFFLATWGPAVAALIVVGAHGGAAGLGEFLGRLALWRASLRWVVLVAVGLPLVFVAGSLIKGGPLLAPLPPEGVGPVLMVMAVMLLLGPVEELGWRGVAQPLLHRMVAPLWAGAIVGVVWGVWHLPAFFLAGTVQSGGSFTPFFVGNVVLAVIAGALLNGTRGSLLWPALFHWQLINPFWPDAQPWDTWILIGVAAGVVWLNRDMMLSWRGAVTTVIPQGGAAP
jgi:membrane protease YdiL (CAAX protease family)